MVGYDCLERYLPKTSRQAKTLSLILNFGYWRAKLMAGNAGWCSKRLLSQTWTSQRRSRLDPFNAFQPTIDLPVFTETSLQGVAAEIQCAEKTPDR